jgi:hypothetical protein
VDALEDPARKLRCEENLGVAYATQRVGPRGSGQGIDVRDAREEIAHAAQRFTVQEARAREPLDQLVMNRDAIESERQGQVLLESFPDLEQRTISIRTAFAEGRGTTRASPLSEERHRQEDPRRNDAIGSAGTRSDPYDHPEPPSLDGPKKPDAARESPLDPEALEGTAKLPRSWNAPVAKYTLAARATSGPWELHVRRFSPSLLFPG